MKRPSIKVLPGSEIISAKGLLVRAVVISLAFVVCHLAGLREFTSILCGMYPSAGDVPKVPAFFGFLYVLMYLAFTIVAPILVIAASLLGVWERLKGGK